MTESQHAVTHFYLAPDAISGNDCHFDSDESHHIANVMRAKIGTQIKATDGRGNIFTVEVAGLSHNMVHGRIVETATNVNELPGELSIAFGLLPGAKIEQIIDQCTQLGATAIQPILCEKIAVTWKKEREANKLERWRRIAVSAMKQSCRCRLPEVLPPVSLDTLCESFKNYDLVLLGSVDGKTISALDLGAPPQRILTITGPEEGFTTSEEEQIITAGAVAVSLGARRLRAELAPVALVSQLLSLL